MVTIEFGGKTRTLRYDMEMLRELEMAMDGKPLLNILSDILRHGVNAVVAALWAGLKHEDKTLHLKLVGKMLGEYLKGNDKADPPIPRGKMRPLVTSIDEALGETGFFDRETEGNEQPEPVAAS